MILLIEAPDPYARRHWFSADSVQRHQSDCNVIAGDHAWARLLRATDAREMSP